MSSKPTLDTYFITILSWEWFLDAGHLQGRRFGVYTYVPTLVYLRFYSMSWRLVGREALPMLVIPWVSGQFRGSSHILGPNLTLAQQLWRTLRNYQTYMYSFIFFAYLYIVSLRWRVKAIARCLKWECFFRSLQTQKWQSFSCISSHAC